MDISPIWRPAFHFTAPKGWINDPNGLIYFKNQYHLFYQYNPYGCEWGSMHWGHAVSDDLFTWKDLPIALRPDKSYDNHPEGGCFSGSGITKDGVLFLYYTGSIKHVQSQNIALSTDGITFKKYHGNPIISVPPAGMGSQDFRDPKVFFHNNQWYLVVGACVGKAEKIGDGRILLYESTDLFHWQYKSILFCSNGRYGTMLECPDFFPLNEKWVLIFSPMNMISGQKCVYITGTMDFETGTFTPDDNGDVDSGFDYYAPQSFLDAEGRRIMIAWMNEWKWMPWFNGFTATASEGWCGTLSIPRQCFFNQKNKLCFLPVSRIENLRQETLTYKNINITTDPFLLHPSFGNQYELIIKGHADKVQSRYLEIILFYGQEFSQSMIVKLSLSHLTLACAIKSDNVSCQRTAFCPLELDGNLIDLHIIVDHSIVEVFVDGGRRCMSFNVYAAKEQTDLCIRTPYKNAILEDLTLNSLRQTIIR
jgi:beta-fructofuranosidase